METIIVSLSFLSVLYIIIRLGVRIDESYGKSNIRYEVESYR